MTADELRERVDELIRTDRRAASILKKIAAGKADFSDTMDYSLISGRLTGAELAAVITETAEGREELAEALLRDRYADINIRCAEVQSTIDERQSVRLAPQKAPFPTERVMKFTDSLRDPTVSDDTIKRRARSVAENVTASFHDDYIKENATFRDRAGFEVYVERTVVGETCPWCASMAGRYLMREQPEGLFRRHDNCDCVIVYDGKVLRGQVGSNGRRTRTWEDTGERAARIEYAESKKPVKLSREEAEKLQAENLPKRLTGGENGGIINPQLQLEAESPFKNPKAPLKIDDVAQSKHIKGGKRYVSYMRNHEYEPSMLTISEEQAQELIDRFHGTGVLSLTKNGDIIENEMIIDNEEVIGYVTNNIDGTTQPTTAFKIHYSNKGTHIVPAYESKKRYLAERRKQNGLDWLLRQKS